MNRCKESRCFSVTIDDCHPFAKMLCSLVAELEAETVVTIPATHGEAMQSELFRQLRGLDTSLTSLDFHA
jgi:hypothetical protein